MTNFNNIQVVGSFDFEDKVMKKPNHPTNQQGIDPILFNAWVNAHQRCYVNVLQKLKKKIVHITFSDFRTALIKSLNDFLKNRPSKFICLVEPGKSQKWVTELAMVKNLKAEKYVRLGEEGANLLKFSLLKLDYEPAIESFRNVVILDDGSFSGNQMSNNISAASRIISEFFGIKPQFFVVVPYMTKCARKKIEKLGNKGIKLKIFTNKQMETVAEAFEKEELEKIRKLFWKNLEQKQALEKARTTALFWFDHKIPNSMSFPEVLAKGVVSQQRTKKSASENVRFIPEIHPPYKDIEPREEE